jgi:hypothetical protein
MQKQGLSGFQIGGKPNCGECEIFTDQTVLFWSDHLILGMFGPKSGVLDISPGITAQEIKLCLLKCKVNFFSPLSLVIKYMRLS